MPLHWNWNSAQIPQILHVGIDTSKCGTGTTLLRYHFATGEFLLGGTGTGLLDTGTTWPLLISCFGVTVPVCMVPVPLPISVFLLTVKLPEASR